MKLFDSHCHLNDEKFDEDKEELIYSLFASEIDKLINAGYSLESSKKAIEIADSYPRNLCNMWNITKRH